MSARGVMISLCIGLAIISVVALPEVGNAQSQCCYFNPLLIPFEAAAGLVGAATAATDAVAGALFSPWYYPYYYRPYYAPAPVAYYGPRPYPRPYWHGPSPRPYGPPPGPYGPPPRPY